MNFIFSVMRNEFYDILRGYAIFLVVLGHVIQSFYPEWKNSSLELFIYSFHMPLFMAISGYFFLHSVDKRGTKEFIRTRFVHLMFPSLTIGLVNCCIVGVSKILTHKQLDFTYFMDVLFTGLWFLVVLFILSVLGCLFRKCLKNKMYLGWIIFLLIFYLIPEGWMVHELKYLAPFFVGAMYLRKYQWDKISTIVTISFTFLFFILFHYFEFSHTMYQMTDDSFSFTFFMQYIYRTLIGISGIIISILFCKCIVSIIFFTNGLVCLGKISLPIYVLHQKFLFWNDAVKLHIDNITGIFCISLVLIILSIFSYKILIRNSILALLLFGKNDLKIRNNNLVFPLFI